MASRVFLPFVDGADLQLALEDDRLFIEQGILLQLLGQRDLGVRPLHWVPSPLRALLIVDLLFVQQE